MYISITLYSCVALLSLYLRTIHLAYTLETLAIHFISSSPETLLCVEPGLRPVVHLPEDLS